MIIITGTGRSGTSLLAKILKDLGFDIHGGWDEEINAGLEDSRVVSLNMKMLADLGCSDPALGWDSFRPKKGFLIKKIYQGTINDLNSSLVAAKDPRFSITLPIWLKNGAKIDQVIVSLRPLEEVYQSKIKYRPRFSSKPRSWWLKHLQWQVGFLMKTISDYNIPSLIVNYPADYKYPRRLAKKMAPFLGVDKQKIVESVRKNLYHLTRWESRCKK